MNNKLKEHAIGSFVFSDAPIELFDRLFAGDHKALNGLQRWQPFEAYPAKQVAEWIMDDYESLLLLVEELGL